MAGDLTNYLVVGRVVGLHGVGGWVKVHSYTHPRENILQYSPWYARVNPRHEWRVLRRSDGRTQGKTIVARLDGCFDRDLAGHWLGVELAITRQQLPVGEHYWVDLEGAQVLTREGVVLGTVHAVMATGANDVLVVHGQRERLIPLVMGVYVTTIDRDRHRIMVDWDPDY